MIKLDKVIKVLTEKINSTRPATRPVTFAIYMDYEFYSMCKMELSNAQHTPLSHLDFLNDDKLFGHPVYRVVSVHGREGLIAHPDFVIYPITNPLHSPTLSNTEVG